MTQQAQRVIDLKLPLSWLIGSACLVIGLVITVTWNASAQTKTLENKIDLLINTSAELKKRLDDRDTKTDNLRDTTRDNIQALDRGLESLKWRVDALERAKK